jgi:hypothetical protein
VGFGCLRGGRCARTAPSGPAVTYDEIMEALRMLDGEARKQPPTYEKLVNRARRLKTVFKSRGSGDVFAN